MFRRLLIGCLPATMLIMAVHAQSGDDSKEVQQVQKQAARLDESARQIPGNQGVFESLSKQLNVPASTLQAEQQSTKFGFGQLFIANSLAQASGKSFDEVAQEFKSGKGWGQIAKENNVKLGKVVSSIKRADNHLRNERNQQLRASQSQSNASSGQRSAARGPAAVPRGRGPRR